MTTPQLILLQGSTSSAPAVEPAAAHATVQLQPSPDMVVHIHLGTAAPTGHVTASAPVRRHPVLTGLAALALLGGGYLAGSRRSDAPVEASPLAALTAPSVLPLTPGLTGEIPQAVRDQLARPPVISRPGGAAAGSSGGPPGTPARNPFGLGN